jgi:hypothetical protein
VNLTVRDIEMTRLLEIVRKPDQKEPPDRIGQESCDDDGPCLPEFKQALRSDADA